MNEMRLLRHPRFEGQIVRPALKQEHSCACVGFSLGRICPEEATACFDFALVAMRFERREGLDAVGLRNLRDLFPVATGVAYEFDRDVIGLWAAWRRWDEANEAKLAKRDAWLAGEACALGLPYVSVTPIDNRWNTWGTWISKAKDFPEKAVRGIRTKGRPRGSPLDNPRRVKAAWCNQLVMHGLPVFGAD